MLRSHAAWRRIDSQGESNNPMWKLIGWGVIILQGIDLGMCTTNSNLKTSSSEMDGSLCIMKYT